MRRFPIHVVAVFTCVSAYATPHICWFDHPSKTPDGVALHFSPTAHASLRVIPAGAAPLDYAEYFLVGGVVHKQQSSDGIAGPVVDELVVQPGTKAYAIGGAHDTCTLEVMENDGRVGVLLDAGSRSPLGPTRATDFVPTE